MKAKVVLEVEVDDEEAYTEKDVKKAVNDYIDIANSYIDNIKFKIEKITVKE